MQLVIATGSFSAAAREANVSQPAISHAMRTLEKELGAVLFQSVGRRKAPTQAALVAAQRAGELEGGIAKMKQAKSHANAHQGHIRGPILNIGMSPAAAILYGAPISRTWHEHQPSALLCIVGGSSPDLLRALERGELDLVIAPLPRRFHVSDLKQHVMFRTLATIYARVGNPMASARSLGDIEGAGWVVVGREGTPSAMIEEACRVRKLQPPNILVQCGDYHSLLHLVANSDMLGAIPHPALLTDSHLAVQPLRIRETLPRYDVSLFYSESRLQDRGPIQSVVQMLTDLAPGIDVVS
ncbi:DNA-binding transcriptional LysR family regulator [Variovorax boronicumulans]